jgi:hypothetical protein
LKRTLFPCQAAGLAASGSILKELRLKVLPISRELTLDAAHTPREQLWTRCRPTEPRDKGSRKN